MLDAGRSEAKIPVCREYWILDAGQIMEDLIPIYRPEGDACIGDAGYWSKRTGGHFVVWNDY